MSQIVETRIRPHSCYLGIRCSEDFLKHFRYSINWPKIHQCQQQHCWKLLWYFLVKSTWKPEMISTQQRAMNPTKVSPYRSRSKCPPQLFTNVVWDSDINYLEMLKTHSSTYSRAIAWWRTYCNWEQIQCWRRNQMAIYWTDLDAYTRSKRAVISSQVDISATQVLPGTSYHYYKPS